MADRFHFEALADVVARFAAPARNAENQYYATRDSMGRGWICADRPWINSRGAALEALKEARFDAGVERIARMGASVQAPTPISVRRVATRAPEGDELDMRRVWQGDLDHAWRRMARQSRVGPMRVLVGVDVGASANVEAEKLAWRGVAALTLADKLLEAGHVVSIVAQFKGALLDERSTEHFTSVQVLAPGEVIDLHKVASLLASPLLMRGVLIGHAFLTAARPLQSGCGMPRTSTVDDLRAQFAGFDYYANCEGNVYNASAASNWIASHVDAIDAHVRGELAA